MCLIDLPRWNQGRLNETRVLRRYVTVGVIAMVTHIGSIRQFHYNTETTVSANIFAEFSTKPQLDVNSKHGGELHVAISCRYASWR